MNLASKAPRRMTLAALLIVLRWASSRISAT